MLPVHVTKYKQTSRTQNMESLIKESIGFPQVDIISTCWQGFLMFAKFLFRCEALCSCQQWNERQELAVCEDEDERFASEMRSLLYLYGGTNINKGLKQRFSEFHDFSDSGCPMATILATNRSVSMLLQKAGYRRETMCCCVLPYIFWVLSRFLCYQTLQKMQNIRALWLFY